MANSEIQIEIESERETAYLLKSETMKAASWRQSNVRKESLSRLPSRSLEFDSAAFEDLSWWVEQDRTQQPVAKVRRGPIRPTKRVLKHRFHLVNY